MGWVRWVSYRVVLLVVGLAFASGSFVVLTSFAEASRVGVKQTVNSSARGSVDLVVRPSADSDGSVDASEYASLYGGISLDQVALIRDTPGVEVAAPVAVVGYVPLFAELDLGRELLPAFKSDPGVVRVREKRTFDGGRSEQVLGARYYVAGDDVESIKECKEDRDNGRGLYPTKKPGDRLAYCVSERDNIVDPYGGGLLSSEYNERYRGLISTLSVSQPYLLAAIDPVAEHELTRFGDVVEGDGLPLEVPTPLKHPGGRDVPLLPLLLAKESPAQTSVELEIARLGNDAASVASAAGSLGVLDDAESAEAVSRSVSSDELDTLVKGHAIRPRDLVERRETLAENPSDWMFRVVQQPRVPVLSARGDGSFDVQAFGNAVDQWLGPFGMGVESLRPVFGMTENAMRPPRGVVRNYAIEDWPDSVWSQNKLLSPAAVVYGSFDAVRWAELNGALGLGGGAADVMAGTRFVPDGDEGALGASPDVNGFVAQGVSAVTTLDALPSLVGPLWMHATRAEGEARRPNPLLPVGAPVSVVRVRVAGVTGVDDASRERIRVVADQIVARTGLSVDVLVGASRAEREVHVPAGFFGRGPLSGVEDFVKRGVAVSIVDAVDWKSVVLFFLVLAVAFFFVVNVIGATVRAEQAETALRVCLGWSPWRLFWWVLGRFVWQCLVAGLLGAGVALVGCQVAGHELSVWYAVWAVPVAMAVGVPAAVFFAAVVSRREPLVLLTSPVAGVRGRVRAVVSVWGMARVSVVRNVSRSVFAVLGVGVAVCASLVVGVVVVQFRGAVVGSLLGEAIAVQVRSVDIVTVAGIVVLSGVGVANVLFINIRERGNEIALLQATGWSSGAQSRLVLGEAVMLGAAGGVFGVVAGLVIVGVLTQAVTGVTLLLAGCCLLVGGLIAVLAAVVPLSSLRRIPTAQLLTEETA